MTESTRPTVKAMEHAGQAFVNGIRPIPTADQANASTSNFAFWFLPGRTSGYGAEALAAQAIPPNAPLGALNRSFFWAGSDFWYPACFIRQAFLFNRFIL